MYKEEPPVWHGTDALIPIMSVVSLVCPLVICFITRVKLTRLQMTKLMNSCLINS